MSKKPPFELIQLRLGFANNSSSSHSLIIFPESTDKLKVKDKDLDSFGWNYFTAASNKAKQDYLADLIHQQISSSVGNAAAAEYIKELLGVDISQSVAEDGVDHQSVFLLPVERDGLTPHRGFIQAFSQWLSQDHVAIVGGNDNDDKVHSAVKKGTAFQLPYLPYDTTDKTQAMVADFDEVQEFWTLFSRKTGAKVRIRFNEGPPLPEHVANLPSTRPSLVDVKITDKCPFKCEYCYQASLPTGQHAPLERIAEIARELGDARVLEVALGGGEPTLHPYFIEILELFSQSGIVPNFTTRNLAWLKNPEKARRITKLTGSFAVSVDSLAEAEKVWTQWKDYIDKNKEDNHRDAVTQLSFQVVVGAVSIDEIKKIMEWSTNDENFWNGPSITLLGYKDVGFGSSWREDKEDVITAQAEWVDMIQELGEQQYNVQKIRIDTALAESAKEKLQAIGVGDRVFHTLEGTTSMYIDAVAETMAPSSYASPNQFEPFDSNWQETFRLFASRLEPSPTIDASSGLNTSGSESSKSIPIRLLTP